MHFIVTGTDSRGLTVSSASCLTWDGVYVIHAAMCSIPEVVRVVIDRVVIDVALPLAHQPLAI